MCRHLLHLLLAWFWIAWPGGVLLLVWLAPPAGEALPGPTGVTEEVARRRPRVAPALPVALVSWTVASAALARATFARLRSAAAIVAAHLAGASIAAGAGFLLLSSALVPVPATGPERQTIGARFTFGPYPDADALRRLATLGITGVVTLLSPTLPRERELLERERAATRAVGLRLIETPILPWISRNQESLDVLRRLALAGGERYYVHCYLGRHRAEIARRVLRQALGVPEDGIGVVFPPLLERGPVLPVDARVAMGPCPTRDEWFQHLVPSGAASVVCLMDDANPEERARIQEERAWAEASGVPFVVLPVRGIGDAERVAAQVTALRAGVYVHSFGLDFRLAWVFDAFRRLRTAGARADRRRTTGDLEGGGPGNDGAVTKY
ncbi:MAG: hypothetical protein HYZ53_11240 [Planctomycetes bacterium]|nr:hypothetical protein [Planctomycetota bacterium]